MSNTVEFSAKVTDQLFKTFAKTQRKIGFGRGFGAGALVASLAFTGVAVTVTYAKARVRNFVEDTIYNKEEAGE